MKDKMQRATVRIQKRSTSKSSLTMREKEILQLLINGKCAAIAEQLFLSVNTVTNYKASIMLKLDVNNTALLVKKALLLGLAQ